MPNLEVPRLKSLDEVVEWLQIAIRYWHGQKGEGNLMAKYYVDAYQAFYLQICGDIYRDSGIPVEATFSDKLSDPAPEGGPALNVENLSTQEGMRVVEEQLDTVKVPRRWPKRA